MPAPKDPEKYALFIERLRRSHRGKKHTPEERAKIAASVSKAKKGVPRPDMRGNRNPMRRPEIAAKRRGPGNGRYKATPSYGGAHDRIDYQRGKPAEHSCEVCGKPAAHWALSHETPLIEIDGRGRRYSLDVMDYIAMCVSCHRRYDMGNLSL